MSRNSSHSQQHPWVSRAKFSLPVKEKREQKSTQKSPKRDLLKGKGRGGAPLGSDGVLPADILMAFHYSYVVQRKTKRMILFRNPILLQYLNG